MKCLVIAPHADDELLGCGGAVLRRVSEGCEVAWLLVTKGDKKLGWSQEEISQREMEILTVRKGLGIAESNFFPLNYPAGRVDEILFSDLIASISSVVKDFKPNEIFIPNSSDIHSDHRVVSSAAAACLKWFRYESIKRVLAYETLSETNFNFGSRSQFRPNYYLDISRFAPKKIDLLRVYSSEIGVHPFPRSIQAVEALALLRGSESGFDAAEAFELLMERM